MHNWKLVLHVTVLVCICVPVALSLTPYLRAVHQNLQWGQRHAKKVHVILGTEACDLDSAVSSIVTGYLLAADSEYFVVPMLNIFRADYYLKTEVEFVFNKHNITSNMLNFLDDVDLFRLHRNNKLAITLVDHNVVSRHLEPVQGSVVQVIDHHKWEANFSSNVERTIETVGSCTTLVGEKFLHEHPELVDELIATLIMSTIIIDTSNFKKSKGTATPKDEAVYDEMERWNPTFDRKKEYKEISAAKDSIDSFTVYDLLRKDLKTAYTESMTIPVPSIPTSLENFVQMANFKADLERFRLEQKAQALVMMTKKSPGPDGSKHGGISLYSKDAVLLQALRDYLVEFDQRSLQLEDMDEQIDPYALDSEIDNLVQNNVDASRKVVLPAIRDFLAQYENRN